MSEDPKQDPPKKDFFKLPADISTMSDGEIDDLAQAIWSKYMDGQDQPKKQ